MKLKQNSKPRQKKKTKPAAKHIVITAPLKIHLPHEFIAHPVIPVPASKPVFERAYLPDPPPIIQGAEPDKEVVWYKPWTW